jgi:hypothetical protein
MYFDERVHLVSVGGGFLRTPFLNSTQDPAPNLRPDQSPVLSPQIVHIPAAGRKSGLNLPSPAYRRAVLTSTLCKRLTSDGAAQVNQEAAGITFGFSEKPDRNMAQARLSGGLILQREPILLLDDIGVDPRRPVDVNVLPTNSMTTGFLAFISRYWQDLRHVDPDLLLRHHTPLQFDCDFDIIPLMSRTFRVTLPILGARSQPIVYDPALGPSSADPLGSPISHFGTAVVRPDNLGGWYIDLVMVPDDEAVVGLAISDDSGQVYSRNLIIQDGFPAGAVVKLPHAMVGVPYYSSLPCTDTLCRIYGQDCSTGNINSDIHSIALPPGLSLVDNDTAIAGTPTSYGANYGIVPSSIIEDGLQSIGISLTVNRPPRSLLVIHEDNNDHSTGEYYACQFLPFGSTLVYGGDAWEFRRFLSNDETWPGVKKVPYLYGMTSRQSAKAQEMAWKETV